MDFHVTKQLKLPIGLILKTFRSNTIKSTHLRTFLYLKFLYPDRFRISSSNLINMAEELNINIKTLNKHLDVLSKNNWIGYDQKKDRIYVRSKNKIKGIFDKTKTQVRIEFKDLADFNPFCLSAIVAYLVKCYSGKSNKPVLISAGTLQGYVGKKKCLTGYAPIAVNYLSKVLNRSKSWIDKYKQLCIKKKLICRIADYYEPGVPWCDKNKYLSVYEVYKGRARFKLVSLTTADGWKHKQMLLIVATDLLSSNLSVYRR